MVKVPQVIVNHIGYDSDYTKNAVFQGTKEIKPVSFDVITYADNKPVYTGTPVEAGEVDRWHTGYYWTMRFDEFKDEGKYYIVMKDAEGNEYKSFPFQIGKNLLEMRTISDCAYYFKAQRPTGEVEAAEKNLPFGGPREGRLDVHGGWYDATGDIGIHMSHLSHSIYFNPQQAAFSAYAFFKINDLLEESRNPEYVILKRRILDEAMYGADYVMRNRAPSGSFYQSKGRAEAYCPIVPTRHLSFDFRPDVAKSQEERKGKGPDLSMLKDEDYECSFRSGAGYCIATLAYAARTQYPSDYHKDEYIAAAIESYDYMYANNEKYTHDGKWNLVDEYCALDALVELYKTTREFDYMRRARDMAERIMSKYVPVDDTMGYLSVNGTKRPFFHAADAGMPMVNLLNYYNIEFDEEERAKVLDIVKKLMKHEIFVTNEVANPFGYARQKVQHADGSIVDQFFYPHDAETAPWWQGENARIGSLSTAARYTADYVCGDCDPEFKAALIKYADDQINWVLGLNPYDSCMMAGAGRNLNYYFYNCKKDFIHCPGGIVNGITGGLHDENGIEFVMEPNDEIIDNWRWAEQWIPHGTWYMYALAMKKI